MDARSLLVRLLEDRRQVDRTAEAGALAAVVGSDDSAILHDQLSAGSDAVGAVVKANRHMTSGGSDRGGERAVLGIVEGCRVAGVVTTECVGKLIARVEKIVGNHLAAAGIDVQRIQASLRRAVVDRRSRFTRPGRDASF